MKNKILSALVVAVVVLFGQSGFAAGTNAVITDLNALVTKINAQLAQGQNTEKDLADDIKEFDVLYAKHKGEKTPEVLQILAMKAKLYLDVLDDPEKAAETFKQIKRDVPELSGCMAHGATRQAAIKNAEDAIKFWIKTAKDDGLEIPEPRGRLVFA